MTLGEMNDIIADFDEFNQDNEGWWVYNLPGYESEFVFIEILKDGITVCVNDCVIYFYKFNKTGSYLEYEIVGLSEAQLMEYISVKTKEIKKYREKQALKQMSEDFE